ncbi:PD-(D/E)XK motif protein [Peribacillus sp. SCS-26]|uniref:PD-(D/E)XK motif protein n=1 Tax=Paraperibacillus marinus TaxID=3115295 RepID=UPI003905E672
MMKRMMMMHTNESLLEKWNTLNIYTNGYMRIDAAHPLEWNIGYENMNQKSLLLITNYEPVTNFFSSKSIIVSKGKRSDSTWAISFRLIRVEQEDVYIRLCLDLIESSRNQRNNMYGLEYVLNRYSQWAKLMEVQPSGLLSVAMQKGLLGEILFLHQVILNGMPALEAVSGWQGIEGADQDFLYSYGWHEVKTVSIGAKTVTISSLEQLDINSPGELILFYLDKTVVHDPVGFTLNGKVNELRESMKRSISALALLNEKLISFGYIDLPEYEKHYYRFDGFKKFRVDEQFPRLVKDNVAVQVVAVKYQLSIQAIEPWKVS